jgi:hypothetical protein
MAPPDLNGEAWGLKVEARAEEATGGVGTGVEEEGS